MVKRAARAPSQRQLRVGEEIRHALSQVLARGDIRDPDLQGTLITVTEVRISPDLKNATAFVIPLGGGESVEDRKKMLVALTRAGPFLKRQLAERIVLRNVPRLSFQADDSFDEASKINHLLHDPKVLKDLQAPDDDTESGGEAGGA